MPNRSPLSLTLNNNNLYLSMFPAKINDKIFQNKEKTLCWGGFCPKKFLQKTLAK